MKTHHLIFPFLFALVIFAHLSPFSARADLNTSTINSTYPGIGPNDVVLHYADLMSGPEPEDKHTGLNAQTDLTANVADSGPVGGKVAMVRMSTEKQHVAEFAGQRLFDVIHDALLKMCPYERGRIGCYSSMPGAAKPTDDNTLQSGYQYYDRYWILDVPYKKDNGEYGTNAWITITTAAIFREDMYPGLGAATYELAAGVYKQATTVVFDGFLRNCYLEEFNKNSRPYTFCNVPKHVLVALPANKGDVTESWLSVTVEFNGKTSYGDFHCYSAVRSVMDFWESEVYPDVAKIFGTSESDWNRSKLCPECFDEDDLFDVITWRGNHLCRSLGWVPDGK